MKRKEKKWKLERLFRGASVFCIDAFRFNSCFFRLETRRFHRVRNNEIGGTLETECKAILFLGKKIPRSREGKLAPKEIATDCLHLSASCSSSSPYNETTLLPL